MGMPLFNYFSNGPFFFDASKQMYCYHNMPAERVEPYDQWDIAWMSVLLKNQYKMLTLKYTFDELPSGETLDIQFSFPVFHFRFIIKMNFSGRKVEFGSEKLQAKRISGSDELK